MQKIPKEQLRKRFQILADTLQDVIFSENSAASIRKASVLGDVEDSVTTLAEMTGLVLMGFLNPADFQAELQKELGVTTDIARQIESSLNAEIFSLIQTELKKLYPPTIKTPTVLSPSFAPKKTPAFAPEGSTAGGPEDKPAAPMIVPPSPLGGETPKLEAAKPSLSEFEKRFFKSAIPSYAKAPESKPKDFTLGGETPKLIKPVVPLPTYIQSQFQRRSSYTEANTDKEPTESRYREKMEEKTPSDSPKSQPRISGNVIDLRNRS